MAHGVERMGEGYVSVILAHWILSFLGECPGIMRPFFYSFLAYALLGFLISMVTLAVKVGAMGPSDNLVFFLFFGVELAIGNGTRRPIEVYGDSSTTDIRFTVIRIAINRAFGVELSD